MENGFKEGLFMFVQKIQLVVQTPASSDMYVEKQNMENLKKRLLSQAGD